jgi:hypothetical protein
MKPNKIYGSLVPHSGEPIRITETEKVLRAEQEPRHPHLIVGSLRQRVEWLLKRNMGLDEQSCANYQDAAHMETLLTELDEAVTMLMLGSSLKARGA